MTRPPSGTGPGGSGRGGQAPTRPYRPSDETKARVLAATTTLLASRPPDSVTLREIADAAGVRHSIIIRYFGSKAALQAEALRQARQAYVEVIEAAPDGVESLVAGFGHLAQHPEATRALLSQYLDGGAAPETGPATFPGMDAHIAKLRQQAGPAAGDPRTIAVAAFALCGGWSILEQWARAAGGLADTDVDALRSSVEGIVRRMVQAEIDAPPGDGPPTDGAENDVLAVE